MKWQDLASVSLPAELTVADLLGVVDQIEQQAVALRSGAARDHGAPHLSGFPRPVDAVLGRLLVQRDGLRTLEAARGPAIPLGSPEARAETNRALDGAWRCFEAVARGCTFLTDGEVPGQNEAVDLYDRVFGTEGMSFINLRPRRQWEASKKRLGALDEIAGLDALLAPLGLTRPLAGLRAAHAAFGEAHGFLAPQPVGAPGVTDTRPAQLATAAALREFLFKVSAQADPDDPESEVWVGYVLAPYAALVAELGRESRSRPAAPAEPAKAPVV